MVAGGIKKTPSVEGVFGVIWLLSSLLGRDESYSKEAEACDKKCICKEVIAGVGVYGRTVVRILVSAYGAEAVYVVMVESIAILLAAIVTYCLVGAGCVAAGMSTSVAAEVADAVDIIVILGCGYGSAAALVGNLMSVAEILILEGIQLVIVRIKLAVGSTAGSADCLSLTGCCAAGVVTAVAAIVTDVIVTVVVALGGYVGSITAGTVEGVAVFVLSPSTVYVLVVGGIELAVGLATVSTYCLSLTGCCTAIVRLVCSCDCVTVSTLESVVISVNLNVLLTATLGSP